MNPNNNYKSHFTIAIQKDKYGPQDSSSPRWTELLEQAGHKVYEVNVFKADILDQLNGADGFMWRHAQFPDLLQIARRLLPVVEREMKLAVYPDQNTCWHYDDKITQGMLFKAANIPTPDTWVWYDRDLTLEWAKKAKYPLVMKLYGGAGSTNVILVNSYNEVADWLDQLFNGGVKSFRPSIHGGRRTRLNNLFQMVPRDIKGWIRYYLEGIPPAPPADPPPASQYWNTHKNYAYFQEFLPGNDYDTRVTVIGNRAFAYRRNNRKDDFRASGSGRIEYDPQQIAPEFIRLAFEVAHKLRTQSCAIDGMWKNRKAVVGEISYTYISQYIYNCPGYWDDQLNWHEAHMWPEEAQIADFLKRLESRQLQITRNTNRRSHED